MADRFLHIGCGTNILPSPFENLDGRDFDGVDYVSSADELSQFDDNTFDMIYFDEHDTYDSVLDNLRLWNSKVKTGGIIAGYDHTRSMYIEVSPTVLAVETFLRKTGYVVQSTEHNSSMYWTTKK